MRAQWKAVSKMDTKKFLFIFSQQRNLKRLRTLGQALGFSLKGFCIGVTGGSLVGYPAAVSGKSMQPVFNFPTRREPTLWQFSCLPVPDEPFSDNMWEEEEIEEWDEEDGVEGVPFFLPLLLELVKSLWTQVSKELFFFICYFPFIPYICRCRCFNYFAKRTQDWVWVNTFAARNYKFGPGDIVVYVSPKDPTDCLIKRVIGLEGDIISSNRYVITTPTSTFFFIA